MNEGRDYPADIEDAPCERCEKPVHLQHDPPCPHGVVVCDMCDIDKECAECAAEIPLVDLLPRNDPFARPAEPVVLYDQAAAAAEAERIATYDRAMRDRFDQWLKEGRP